MIGAGYVGLSNKILLAQHHQVITLDLKAVRDREEAVAGAEYVLWENPEAVIVIKSTIPVGYTEKLREKYQTDRMIMPTCSRKPGNLQIC